MQLKIVLQFPVGFAPTIVFSFYSAMQLTSQLQPQVFLILFCLVIVSCLLDRDLFFGLCYVFECWLGFCSSFCVFMWPDVLFFISRLSFPSSLLITITLVTNALERR